MAFTDYVELAKVRLTAMVLGTTAVGYVMAARPVDWRGLLLTVVGTGLAAVGAGTFNQILERDRDAQMERTRNRPLPAGRIAPGQALVFGLLAAAAGLAVLNECVNPLTALLGLANILIYTLVYTPLKPRTPLSTLLGAVCGALPPVMGWTGAVNAFGLGTGLLAAILFLWQIPHFLSLVWLYRTDYANAGYRLLPVTDPTGRLTCLLIVLYSLALLPLGLAATFCGLTGYLFAAASLALSLGLFLLALHLFVVRTRPQARRVFLASLAYLPLLLAVLLADARPASPRPADRELFTAPPPVESFTAN